jgi:hypothetical protein
MRKERKCKFAEDKSGDVYECNGYYSKEVECPFQYKDLNPDKSVNICECKKYEVEK